MFVYVRIADYRLAGLFNTEFKFPNKSILLQFTKNDGVWNDMQLLQEGGSGKQSSSLVVIAEINDVFNRNAANVAQVSGKARMYKLIMTIQIVLGRK